MKKQDIIYYLEMLTIFIIFNMFLILTPSASSDFNDCTKFDTGWTISTAKSSAAFDVLPSYYYNSDSGNEVWLSKNIQNIKQGKSIGFFSFQQQVLVYINGEQVFDFVPDDNVRSLTPGNKWIFINLDSYGDSCDITIRIKDCYASDRISIPAIYYGTQAGMVLTYLKTEIPHMLVSMLLILFGVVLLICCIAYRKKAGFEKNLSWLALFAISRGIWTLLEANVYSFFFTKLLLISQLSYMALKISATTYFKFVNVSYHAGKSRILNVLVILTSADFWISLICQYFLGIDFAYTVYITHILFIFGGIYACISSFYICRNKSLFEASTNNGTVLNEKSYVIHVFSSLAVVIASAFDLVRYYFFHSPDVARFCRWGDLIYIVAVSVSLFSNFINLLKMGQDAEQIKEEAATDPLTKLANRSSFERDITAGSSVQWMHQGIAMLDLNNLKHFNDVHGHGMGDYYIIISSEIIRDAFSPYGRVYRIGGDEFCAIVRDLSMEDYITVRTHIEDYMSSLKMPSSDLHMEISAGYAQFDANLDHSLRDTMKRADDLMYQRKMELKSHRD